MCVNWTIRLDTGSVWNQPDRLWQPWPPPPLKSFSFIKLTIICVLYLCVLRVTLNFLATLSSAYPQSLPPAFWPATLCYKMVCCTFSFVDLVWFFASWCTNHQTFYYQTTVWSLNVLFLLFYLFYFPIIFFVYIYKKLKTFFVSKIILIHNQRGKVRMSESQFI